MYIGGTPGASVPVYIHGSWGGGGGIIPISLIVMVILSNQWQGIHCRPYRFFLNIHNSSVWLNGHPIGGLIILVSFSGNLVLWNEFLQPPWWRRHWCSMSMVVSWFRKYYKRTWAYFLFTRISGARYCLPWQFCSWLCAVFVIVVIGLQSTHQCNGPRGPLWC